jgi:hypothetical protein
MVAAALTTDTFKTLTGLSYQIDLKNFTKFTELSLTKGRGWFLNFVGVPMIL